MVFQWNQDLLSLKMDSFLCKYIHELGNIQSNLQETCLLTFSLCPTPPWHPPIHPPNKQNCCWRNSCPDSTRSYFDFLKRRLNTPKSRFLPKLAVKLIPNQMQLWHFHVMVGCPRKCTLFQIHPCIYWDCLTCFAFTPSFVIVIININHNVIHLVTKSDNVHLQRCHLKTYDDSNALWKCMNAAMLQYGAKCSSKVQCTNCVQK